MCILTAVIVLPGCTVENDLVEIEPIHELNQVRIFDRVLFESTLPEIDSVEVFQDVRILLCPHHQLASELIHAAMMAVDSESYDAIVIIGPDHKSLKGVSISITGNNWATPWGTLRVDDKTNEALLAYEDVEMDDAMMMDEQSTAALVPYIAYHFPGVSVNAIALPSTMNKDETEAFGVYLSSVIDEHTLVLASVDFSHNLTYDEANENDEETLEYLRLRDFDGIYHLGSEHLDSPQTMIAVLAFALEEQIKFMEVIDHSNAYEIQPDTKQKTTSYFTIIFQ
jgi:AmmeMemoRadiSam system protein B